MKRYIILSIFIFSACYGWAQDMKYKELIEIIKQGREKEAFSVLFDFQKKNPEFANTYFHLGNISFNWMKNSDPLVDYDKTMQYVDNTKLFYSLSIAKMTEQSRDAKKYDTYYRTIPEFNTIKKLENQIVIDYMNKQLAKTEEYVTKTTEIVNLFHNIIKSYSKTQKVFSEFITVNDNLNSILIQPLTPTLSKTNEIVLLYDSTLYFYEQYKTALANYPIKDYNQQIIEKPITTYRLEGMEGTNFLADTIYIWDYKKWAQSIQNKLKSDVDHFRKTIEKTNKLISDKDKELTKLTKATSAYKKFLIDQVVSFEVEKYDYNSIISSLFKYRVKKVNYLIKSKEYFNSRKDTSYSPTSRAVEYYKLIKEKKDLDSLLKVFKSSIDDDNYVKHQYFFDKYYDGRNGLNRFPANQTLGNNKIYQQALSNFNYFIYRDVFMQSPDSQTVQYENADICVNVKLTNIQDSEKQKYYTLDRASINNIDYVTGYYVDKRRKAVPFVAKIVIDNVMWLKLLKNKSSEGFGVKISAKETGCVVAIHLTNSSENSSSIVQFATDGKELLRKELLTNKMPRFINFDDINSNVIIALQGQDLNYFSDNVDNALEIKKVNTLSGEFEIDKTFVLNGKLTNILQLNSEYYLFANFKQFGFGTSIINSDAESIGFMKLSGSGDITDMVKLNTKEKLWALYALKINDKTLSLVTYKNKANIYNLRFQSLPAMYNVIISPKGKILY